MTTKTKLKLEQVLRNNPLQPLVIAGNEIPEMENSISLMASVDERELHIPSGWHKLLEMKAQNQKAYLVIESLDEVDCEKQEQFAGLVKDRRAGNYKLPANVQIVIPVRDKSRLSKKIQLLSLIWDIE